MNNIYKINLEKQLFSSFTRTEIHFSKKFSKNDNIFKKILIKHIKEIEEFSNFKINYSKIKVSQNNNSPIVGIKIILLNLSKYKDLNKIDLFMKLISPFSLNLNLIENFIKKQSLLHSFDYIKRNIEYSILHGGKKFDKFLIEAIKYDFINSRFKNRIKIFTENYKVISYVNKNYHSLADFKKNIFLEIEKYRLDELIFIVNFLKQSFDILETQFYRDENLLQNDFYNSFYIQLKERNECVFETKKIVIAAEFNKYCSDSNIVIFEK